MLTSMACLNCSGPVKPTSQITGTKTLLDEQTSLSAICAMDQNTILAGTNEGLIYVIVNDSIKQRYNTNSNTHIYKISAQIIPEKSIRDQNAGPDTLYTIGLRNRKSFQFWRTAHEEGKSFKQIKQFSIAIKEFYSTYDFIETGEKSGEYLVCTSNGLYISPESKHPVSSLVFDSLKLIHPPMERLKKLDDFRYPVHNVQRKDTNSFVFSTPEGIMYYDKESQNISFYLKDTDIQYVYQKNDTTYALSKDSIYTITYAPLPKTIKSETLLLPEAVAYFKDDNGIDWFFSRRELLINDGYNTIKTSNIIDEEGKSTRSYYAKGMEKIRLISSTGGKEISLFNIVKKGPVATITTYDPILGRVFLLDNENYLYRKKRGEETFYRIGKLAEGSAFNRMAVSGNTLYLATNKKIVALKTYGLFSMTGSPVTLFECRGEEEIKELGKAGGQIIVGTDNRLLSIDQNNKVLIRSNIESVYPANRQHTKLIIRTLDNHIYEFDGKTEPKGVNYSGLMAKYMECVSKVRHENYIFNWDSVIYAIDRNSVTRYTPKSESDMLKGLSILPFGCSAVDDSTILISTRHGSILLNTKCDIPPDYSKDLSEPVIGRDNSLFNCLISFSILAFIVFLTIFIRHLKKVLEKIQEQSRQKALMLLDRTEQQLLALRGVKIPEALQLQAKAKEQLKAKNHKGVAEVSSQISAFEERYLQLKEMVGEVSDYLAKLPVVEGITEEYHISLNTIKNNLDSSPLCKSLEQAELLNKSLQGLKEASISKHDYLSIYTAGLISRASSLQPEFSDILTGQIDELAASSLLFHDKLVKFKLLEFQIKQAQLLDFITKCNQHSYDVVSARKLGLTAKITEFYNSFAPGDLDLILDALTIKSTVCDHAKVFCILLSVPHIETVKLESLLTGKYYGTRRSEIKHRLIKNKTIWQSADSILIKQRINLITE